MKDKSSLRKAARSARKEAFATVLLPQATARLLNALAGKTGPVAFYWPMRTEIDPRPAMEAVAAERQVLLPVTHGHGPLTFRPWHSGLALSTDSFGTQYPGEGPDLDPATLVVPLLAFDRMGHRLGYGAGHYDRTLVELRARASAFAIGYAFAAQEIPRVPNEPTDQPLDLIVTEGETITPGG